MAEEFKADDNYYAANEDADQNNSSSMQQETSTVSAFDMSKADDSKKIFVGGLNWTTTDDDLVRHFSQFGKVLGASIKIDKFSNKSRGFGFVLFEDDAGVSKALNYTEHMIKDKKIDPKPAKPARDIKNKIFIGGLDPDVTEDQIREYFGQFGTISSLELPFDRTSGKRRAYAFITYSSETEANEAAKKEKQEINGKNCDVRIAIPQEQMNRQKYGYQQNNWYGGGGGYGYDNYGGGYDAYGYGYGGGYGGGGYQQNYGGDYYDQGQGDYNGGYRRNPRRGGGYSGSGNAGGYHPYNRY